VTAVRQASVASTVVGSGQADRLKVSLLSEEAFAAYRDPWNALLDESASESFFLRWEWAYSFWRTIDSRGATLLVLVCHDGEQLVGIAPLYAYPSTFMRWPVRKITFLGDRVASDYMDFIVRPGYEARCCRSVLRHLRQDCPVRYELIELDAVCSDSGLYRYASTRCATDGSTSIAFRFQCPRAPLQSSFEDYLKGLSSSTRYAIGRRERGFASEFPRHQVTHVDMTREPGLLDALFELHRRRWETVTTAASTFYSDFRMRFNRDLLGRLGDGDGYFTVVSTDGRPVSIVYTFAYKKNAFFYQNGWAPEFARHGVGLIAIQHAIRHAARAGFSSFDFLRGEEDYKFKFCRDVRNAYVVRIFGNGVRGRLLGMLEAAKQRVKRGLRDAGAEPAALGAGGAQAVPR